MAQLVKNLPEVQETWIQYLGQEDPLEKGMTTHSSILAWRVSWTEEPGGLQIMGVVSIYKKSDTTEWLTLSIFKLAGNSVNKLIVQKSTYFPISYQSYCFVEEKLREWRQ